MGTEDGAAGDAVQLERLFEFVEQRTAEFESALADAKLVHTQMQSQSNPPSPQNETDRQLLAVFAEVAASLRSHRGQVADLRQVAHEGARTSEVAASLRAALASMEETLQAVNAALSAQAEALLRADEGGSRREPSSRPESGKELVARRAQELASQQRTIFGELASALARDLSAADESIAAMRRPPGGRGGEPRRGSVPAGRVAAAPPQRKVLSAKGTPAAAGAGGGRGSSAGSAKKAPSPAAGGKPPTPRASQAPSPAALPPLPSPRPALGAASPAPPSVPTLPLVPAPPNAGAPSTRPRRPSIGGEGKKPPPPPPTGRGAGGAGPRGRRQSTSGAAPAAAAGGPRKESVPRSATMPTQPAPPAGPPGPRGARPGSGEARGGTRTERRPEGGGPDPARGSKTERGPPASGAPRPSQPRAPAPKLDKSPSGAALASPGPSQPRAPAPKLDKSPSGAALAASNPPKRGAPQAAPPAAPSPPPATHEPPAPPPRGGGRAPEPPPARSEPEPPPRASVEDWPARDWGDADGRDLYAMVAALCGPQAARAAAGVGARLGAMVEGDAEGLLAAVEAPGGVAPLLGLARNAALEVRLPALDGVALLAAHPLYAPLLLQNGVAAMLSHMLSPSAKPDPRVLRLVLAIATTLAADPDGRAAVVRESIPARALQAAPAAGLDEGLAALLSALAKSEAGLRAAAASGLPLLVAWLRRADAPALAGTAAALAAGLAPHADVAEALLFTGPTGLVPGLPPALAAYLGAVSAGRAPPAAPDAPPAAPESLPAPGLDALLSLMRADDYALASAALSAVAPLAAHPRLRPRLVAAGLLPVCAELLAGGPPDSQRAAARLAVNCSVDDSLTPLMLEAGLAAPLAALAASADAPPEVARFCAVALANLSERPANRLALLAAGAGRAFASMAAHPSEHIRRQASRALCNLAADDEARRVLSEGEEAARVEAAVLALMDDARLEIRRAGLAALAGLTESARWRVRALEGELLGAALGVLESDVRDDVSIRSAVRAMANAIDAAAALGMGEELHAMRRALLAVSEHAPAAVGDERTRAALYDRLLAAERAVDAAEAAEAAAEGAGAAPVPGAAAAAEAAA